MQRRPNVKYREWLPGDKAYLYAIECDGYYKVGITTNVANRMATMQTGNPHEMRIRMQRQVPCEVSSLAEIEMHLALKPFHIRGEWFKCDYRTLHISACKAIRIATKAARASPTEPIVDVQIQCMEQRIADLKPLYQLLDT
jgi:hypothetical protein